MSKYQKTVGGSIADLKVAYTVQLNNIKPKTKYKIIPLNRIQEIFDGN